MFSAQSGRPGQYRFAEYWLHSPTTVAVVSEQPRSLAGSCKEREESSRCKCIAACEYGRHKHSMMPTQLC